jgi:hypothetical protein
MPVWNISSIDEEPETKLHDWRVYEVQQSDRDGRTRHLLVQLAVIATVKAAAR